MKTIIASLSLVFALSLTLTPITRGQQPQSTTARQTDQDDVRAEIVELKRLVAQLQRRLDALENKPAAAKLQAGDIITLIDHDADHGQIQRIAAAVTQIQPNGNLSIEAKRTNQDEATTTETTITGVIRTATIAAQSRTVSMDEIENLRISKFIRRQ